MNQKLSWREVLKQQWFMTKFCFRTTPGFLAFHIFESMKLQFSIFMEFNWTVNYILEVAEQGGDFRKVLLCMGILMAAIALSTVTFAIYMHYVTPKAKPALYQALRMEIYNRAKELDLSCYDDREFYERFILATEETDQCIDRYLDAVQGLSGGLVGLICALVFCVYLNPWTLLIIAATLPIELYLLSKANEKRVALRMERVSHEQTREYGNRVFYLADYAKDLRMNAEMKEKCRRDYREANEKIREVHKRYADTLLRYDLFQRLFLSRGMKEGLIWTVLLYQTLVLETLSCAHLISSRNSIYRFNQNCQRIKDNWRSMAENAAYIRSIRELLDLESTILSSKNQAVPERPGTISVEHVDFSYLPGKPVLHDISLTIKPGEKIALVGYNGSGKSTLVKLLLRLYDPSSGRICYHGTDIRDYEVTAYRHSIGSVFQDYKIYAASLKENVLMDVESGTKEEKYAVEEALYDAHFTLEDHRLSYQIETPLTTEFEKDGVSLSGGEAQKVAIARTLYRRQNIIIMDEPSSALDPLAEYQLNQELNEIAKDKTVIFISHRLSTTRDADRIYMMEQGRIIEAGTHQELLEMDGKYAAMWKVQAGLYRL